MSDLSLIWHGPYSFRPSNDARWFAKSSYVTSGGIYLWTYRFSDEHRINYVGRTTGFTRRFASERSYSRNGKIEKGKFSADPLIDVNRFLTEGVRVVVNPFPTKQDLATARDDIERTLTDCRIFVSLLEDDRQPSVEYVLTEHIWDRYPEFMHYPANLDQPKVLHDGPPSDLPNHFLIENMVESEAWIRGLDQGAERHRDKGF